MDKPLSVAGFFNSPLKSDPFKGTKRKGGGVRGEGGKRIKGEEGTTKGGIIRKGGATTTMKEASQSTKAATQSTTSIFRTTKKPTHHSTGNESPSKQNLSKWFKPK